MKHCEIESYKDLSLHLAPLVRAKTDLEATRVSKFVNNNMKTSLDALIGRKIDMSRRYGSGWGLQQQGAICPGRPP